MSKIFSTLIVSLVLAAGGCTRFETPLPPPMPHKETIQEVKFVDLTEEYGLQRNTCTFSAAFCDLNNDGLDDLVVSNHGHNLPSILINQNGLFADESCLFPATKNRDRHHIGLVDLDNDGDKDMTVAGGGSDGIGPGWSNEVYHNLLMETGILSFLDISESADLEYRLWRSRTFLPYADAHGAMVDLYLVCKSRAGAPNLYFKNMSDARRILFAVDDSAGLNMDINSDGLDVFFDFDRDGDRDLLILERLKPVIYKNENNRFIRKEELFMGINSVNCLGVGDLNNDRFPDLFFGRWCPSSYSDNVSFNSEEIHFVLYDSKEDKGDQIDFKTEDQGVNIDFLAKHGLDIDDPSDIYLGKEKKNPASRMGFISAEDAQGSPVIDEPGIYFWKEGDSFQWHLVSIYGGEKTMQTGKIICTGIFAVCPFDLEVFDKMKIGDLILINNNGREFLIVGNINLIHDKRTRSVCIVDLNNDGFMDIVGIRGSEWGDYNGEAFVILNEGTKDGIFRFREQEAAGLSSEKDDIFQADQLIYGFVNDDGLPDLFITNGYGLVPGLNGPYGLFINQTNTANNYTILELQGTMSNRDALGAQIELFDGQGNLLGYRELGVDYNRAQRTHKMHFGLGTYQGVLQAAILWPGGIKQLITVNPNTVNIVKEEY